MYISLRNAHSSMYKITGKPRKKTGVVWSDEQMERHRKRNEGDVAREMESNSQSTYCP